MHCIIKRHRQKAWDDKVAPSVYITAPYRVLLGSKTLSKQSSDDDIIMDSMSYLMRGSRVQAIFFVHMSKHNRSTFSYSACKDIVANF